MKKSLVFKFYLGLSILTLLKADLIAQNELMTVEGAVNLGASEVIPPIAGTLQWTGIDFEAWDGASWKSLTSGTIVYDADGNAYNAVAVGKQVWLRQHLRTTLYADSTSINHITSPSTWQTTKGGAYTWYNNTSSYEIPRGKLYNWYTVNNLKGVCPNGWRVPNLDDIIQLKDYLVTNIGGRMKEYTLYHWPSPNSGAKNESELKAIPAGKRNEDGTFEELNTKNIWWTKDAVDMTTATAFELSHTSSSFVEVSIQKRTGASIRCIKD